MNPRRGIFFKKDRLRGIEIYMDADHGKDLENRRSTRGYFTFLWGNLITWRSKKKIIIIIVPQSSTKAKARAFAHRVCEGIWLMRLLKELKDGYQLPTQLWCDSMFALQMVNNHVHYDRTKHMEIDEDLIIEKIEDSTKMSCINITTQVADLHTKAYWKN